MRRVANDHWVVGMEFAFPEILLAATAIAAPIIIHLTMRTRPRRVVLPTLRFVQKIHQAHRSRMKLKQLLLLLLRMAAVFLLVFLIARPSLSGISQPVDSQDPVAMVVVLDTSGSMTYRHQGRRLWERARGLVLDVFETLPPGSRIAVLTTDGLGDSQGFLAGTELASRHMMDVPTGFGDQSFGPVLPRALDWLREIPLTRKELLILTDNTVQAWQGVSPLDPEQLERMHVWVANVGVETDANIALGAVDLEHPQLPMGSGTSLHTSLSSRHLGGELTIQTVVDDKPVDRRSVELEAGSLAGLTMQVVAEREGAVSGSLELITPDALDADNMRYFTLSVTPPAEVLFVSTPAPQIDDTAFLMEMAIAPPMPGSETQLRRRSLPPEGLTAETLEAVPLVVLANAAAITDDQWRILERYVRQGGQLWVVPGSMVSAEDYNSEAAQRLLPAAFRGQEQLTDPLALAEPDVSHPMLKPFGDPLNPPLTGISCMRRLGLDELAEGTDVVLRYVDDTPAILMRPFGAGRVVLWTFSPNRAWANFDAYGGAQLLVLATRTTELLLAGESYRTQWLWEQQVVLPIPGSMAMPTATLRRPGQKTEEPLQVDTQHRQVTLRADELGNYTVVFEDGVDTREMGFSVNLAASESDLTPMTAEQLAALLPEEHCKPLESAKDRLAQSGEVVAPLDLLPILLLVLLVVLTGETYFSNRFYRQPEIPADGDVARDGLGG